MEAREVGGEIKEIGVSADGLDDAIGAETTVVELE